MSLFSANIKAPLADRMRPHTLAEFVGQSAVIGQGRYLERMIKEDKVPSLIFYGPPGTGKTTLAHIVAAAAESQFEEVNAVSSGVADLRKVINAAKERRMATGVKTILFIDEIHRFNKAQQDVLLPFVENGTVTLIGATTENPFFEVNSPLLSRMKIIRLESLQVEDIEAILRRALADEENGYGKQELTADDEGIRMLAEVSGGDARIALKMLEQAVALLNGQKHISSETAREVLSEAGRRYDKKGDQHYDVISAFIKSMRGSDPDAALHYLARMIEGGEDLKFIARRIVICAAEDVGLADPNALVVAMAAAQAAQFVGFPEARIPLAEAVCYIAAAPKSNSAYVAIDNATRDVRAQNCGRVPAHLRDASYKSAKVFGHGVGYKYPHDYPGGYVEQEYLPEELKGRVYYQPSDHGIEERIGKRLDSLRKKRT